MSNAIIPNNKPFFDLVSKMRKAQKDYFRTRSSNALNEAKRLEQQVDDALSNMKVVQQCSLI